MPEETVGMSQPPVRIIVLDRGFVYVGFVRKDGDDLIIEKARNIRYWGTTKGLGELVSGPTANTKHDRVGTVRAPFRAVIHQIDCEGNGWTKEL